MNRTLLGRAIVAGLGLGALLVPASSALGFTSNRFESPSGNILCRYDNYSRVMACMTLNDSFVAAVPVYGRSYKTRGGTFRNGPTLYYGDYWTASGRFRCNSALSGMTCRSVQSGHGFFLSRTSYRLF
ncbi:MAG: hypothetical protein QOK40_1586 [Miltoncostaeaceae bacterium]|jgi:hypothetical protein|nr:hypothetical protein [Miltoncostaeaceae bacterium]